MVDMLGAEEVNLGCEFEHMNKMYITDDTTSVTHFDGLDNNEGNMGIKFELIDDEIMQKESLFETQPDGSDSDKKLTSTPVSRVKEVCMNLQAMANGSFPVNVF